MSGTPLLDKVAEAFAHFRLLHVLGLPNFRSFKRDFNLVGADEFSKRQDILNEVMIRRDHNTVMFKEEEILQLPEMMIIRDQLFIVHEIGKKLATRLSLGLQAAIWDFKSARKQKQSVEILLGMRTKMLTMLQYGRMAASHPMLIAQHLPQYLYSASLTSIQRIHVLYISIIYRQCTTHAVTVPFEVVRRLR